MTQYAALHSRPVLGYGHIRHIASQQDLTRGQSCPVGFIAALWLLLYERPDSCLSMNTDISRLAISCFRYFKNKNEDDAVKIEAILELSEANNEVNSDPES